MRVVIVNTSDIVGGAAIAANRLLRALNRNGVEASMLVRDKKTDNPRVEQLPPSPLRRAKFVAERAQIYLKNGWSKNNLFGIDIFALGNDIADLPSVKRADVVHLHWVNQAMLSFRTLEKLMATGKRVVWTMHDMWPFTGICHCTTDCTHWRQNSETGCQMCPLLNKPGTHDLSAKIFAKKQRFFAQHQITMVGCSRWIAQMAAESKLLQGQKICSIPNPLDTQFYCSADKTAERQKLGLPLDKTLIFFAAYKATDKNKGIDYLKEALDLLAQQSPQSIEEVAVVVAGYEAEQLKDTMAVPVIPVGFIGDSTTMRQYYRASDLLAMPTLIDNLPNTIAEASACELPVVAFSVGGVPQMIDHDKTGMLVRYKDSVHLAECLNKMIHQTDRTAMGKAARQKAIHDYSEQAVAESYLRVYEECLNQPQR